MREIVCLSLLWVVGCDSSDAPSTDLGADQAVADGEVPAEGLIPEERRITWRGNVGVPGGIPNRTTICQSLGTAGQAPSFSQPVSATDIETAIAGCPPEQVVFLNQGTYDIAEVSLGKHGHVTLRGAGPGKTILRCSGSGQACISTEQYSFGGGVAVMSGADQGSTSIVVADASGFAVDNLVKLDADDDIDFVLATNGPERHMGFVARVTALSGSTISFAPPLPWKLDASRAPRAAYLNGGPGIELTRM